MVSLYSPGYKLVASCWFAFDATVATYQLLGLYQSALFFAYCTVLTYTVTLVMSLICTKEFQTFCLEEKETVVVLPC